MMINDALNIIVKHQIKPAVITTPIAKELGMNVYEVDGWSNNLSGKLRKDPQSESGFSIYINKNHALVRRRFTVAHEIAHFILHRDLIKDCIVDDALYRSGLSNAIEAAANKLAADILMPWHLVNKAVDSGMNTIEALAREFNVSNSAMAIRLGIPNES